MRVMRASGAQTEEGNGEEKKIGKVVEMQNWREGEEDKEEGGALGRFVGMLWV